MVARARADVAALFGAGFDGIIVERVYRDEIAGLPDPQEGVVYIASAVIAADVRRPDVLSPGRLVRDDDGAVIGAAGLVRHND